MSRRWAPLPGLGPAAALASCSMACASEGSDWNAAVGEPVLVSDGDRLRVQHVGACCGIDLRGTWPGSSHRCSADRCDGAVWIAVRSGAQPHHRSVGEVRPVAPIAGGERKAVVASSVRSRRSGLEQDRSGWRA